ncbi:polysaccharide biosynthesis protein [Variovorax sp. H27-G14]|uniref:lipopolysaccharide biosynthesis protein n=1 Tax=Variovorax sp. H27-G14 TaxID=3111914 RepID=UPI0038FC4B74
MKPFSPSLALPGARMAWLAGLGALASRMYVYLSGFLAVFLMAASISPARFGEYSVYQSVIEVALVLGTLGSSLLFSRNAASVPPGVTRGDVVRTLSIGLPLAMVLVTVILALQRLPVGDAPFVLVVATLAIFSFNSLRLSFSRGLGHAGLLNLEAGIRSTILVLGVGLCTALKFDLGVAHLLLINLFALVVVCVAIGLPGNGAAPPAGPHAIGLLSQATATVYSLLTFLLRKSDLLVVAYFMPLSYVGAFKLAFLLAEAPSQFVQAFLFTKTKAMLEADPRHFGDAQLGLARHSFLLGCGLFVGLGCVMAVAAPLLKLGEEARSIFLCMAPYFLLRTYTIHHEMVLSLKTSMGSLGRWALLEVALRFVSYAVVIVLFPGKPHYVFLLACVSDFVLYETRMRLVFGFFPLQRLLRMRSTA